MNKSQAISEVKRAFSRFKTATQHEDRWLAGLAGGKVYELFCLAKVLDRLRSVYGFQLRFHGNDIVFQASPGLIDRSKPHFSIYGNSTLPTLELFTDVEFATLGSISSPSTDLSGYHEIDILVVAAGVIGRPSHLDIALGVECKSHANFTKSIVKEVLGIRREMVLLTKPQQSLLARLAPRAPPVSVPADPASEYWLAFTDSRGLQYSSSPSTFGITFEHWQP